MRRVIVSFFVLTFLICFSSPGFAQLRKDMQIIYGKLVSMDVNKREVTIKDAAGQEMTFVVKKGVDPSLQIGNEVVVMYKIGTNAANWVKLPKNQR